MRVDRTQQAVAGASSEVSPAAAASARAQSKQKPTSSLTRRCPGEQWYDAGEARRSALVQERSSRQRLRTTGSGANTEARNVADDRFDPRGRCGLRDRNGDLCCAQDYVAYRAEREGASGCLRADRGLWGRRRFPIVESSAQHIFGWFDIATVALRSDHESLDWADMYVEASTELKRCVLDRDGPPNRQAWPVSHQPRRARGSRAVNRAETMLRW